MKTITWLFLAILIGAMILGAMIVLLQNSHDENQRLQHGLQGLTEKNQELQTQIEELTKLLHDSQRALEVESRRNQQLEQDLEQARRMTGDRPSRLTVEPAPTSEAIAECETCAQSSPTLFIALGPALMITALAKHFARRRREYAQLHTRLSSYCVAPIVQVCMTREQVEEYVRWRRQIART